MRDYPWAVIKYLLTMPKNRQYNFMQTKCYGLQLANKNLYLYMSLDSNEFNVKKQNRKFEQKLIFC